MVARLAGNDDPQRPPIVLVHGLSMSSRYMMPTARLLADEFAVYVPDLPGFGRSAKPPQAFNTVELSDHLYAWMQECGLATATFVGNSFGCQVIVDLALRYPAAVKRAILTGPTGDPTRCTVGKQVMLAAADAIFSEPPSLIWVGLQDYLAAGPWRTLRTLRHLLDDVIEEKLPDITAPMLIVRGSKDHIVSHAWADQAARILPQGRLETLVGASHAVNYSAADALVRVIREFCMTGSILG